MSDKTYSVLVGLAELVVFGIGAAALVLATFVMI